MRAPSGTAVAVSGSMRLAQSTSRCTILPANSLGLPVYKLMGGARRPHLEPYCTIYPGLAHGRSIAELMKEIGRQFDKALAIGFRAVKMEVLFYDLVTDAELVEPDSPRPPHARRRHDDGDRLRLPLEELARCTLGACSAWPTATFSLPRPRCSMMISTGHASLAAISPIRICRRRGCCRTA